MVLVRRCHVRQRGHRDGGVGRADAESDRPLWTLADRARFVRGWWARKPGTGGYRFGFWAYALRNLQEGGRQRGERARPPDYRGSVGGVRVTDRAARDVADTERGTPAGLPGPWNGGGRSGPPGWRPPTPSQPIAKTWPCCGSWSGTALATTSPTCSWTRRIVFCPGCAIRTSRGAAGNPRLSPMVPTPPRSTSSQRPGHLMTARRRYAASGRRHCRLWTVTLRRPALVRSPVSG